MNKKFCCNPKKKKTNTDLFISETIAGAGQERVEKTNKSVILSAVQKAEHFLKQ